MSYSSTLAPDLNLVHSSADSTNGIPAMEDNMNIRSLDSLEKSFRKTFEHDQLAVFNDKQRARQVIDKAYRWFRAHGAGLMVQGKSHIVIPDVTRSTSQPEAGTGSQQQAPAPASASTPAAATQTVAAPTPASTPATATQTATAPTPDANTAAGDQPQPQQPLVPHANSPSNLRRSSTEGNLSTSGIIQFDSLREKQVVDIYSDHSTQKEKDLVAFKKNY